MQHVGLLILLAAGCVTTAGVGAQAIATPEGEGSVEAMVAGGVGFGDEDSGFLARAEGGLGVANGGGVQGRVQLGNEWVRLGEKVGWHVRGGIGGSFGAYQSPDLTVQLTGGPQWTVHRSETRSVLRVTSVALDATVGYGFRAIEEEQTLPLRRDGAFVGLGLSVRRDTVSDLGIKYGPRSRLSAAGLR